MRKIRYKDYLARRADMIGERLRLEKKRGVRSRQRSKVERELLLNLDKTRFERWKRTGKITVIGPRKYKFSLDVLD